MKGKLQTLDKVFHLLKKGPVNRFLNSFIYRLPHLYKLCYSKEKGGMKKAN